MKLSRRLGILLILLALPVLFIVATWPFCFRPEATSGAYIFPERMVGNFLKHVQRRDGKGTECRNFVDQVRIWQGKVPFQNV